MLKVVDLPIEPLEQRYSVQWARWIAHVYKDKLGPEGTSWIRIHGRTESGEVEPGLFLDPHGTTEYKLSQGYELAQRLRQIPDEATLFFHDIWNPVVIQAHYYRCMANRKWRIFGFMHAGSWDNTDLLSMADKSGVFVDFERSLVWAADSTFYATHYAAERATNRLGKHRFSVVGEPIEHIGFCSKTWNDRRRIIAWPHRIAPDKDLNSARYVAKQCGADLMVTRAMGFGKANYYAFLRSAKVALSTATHENFGIGMLEAASAGCRIVVPDRLSYREIWPDRVRYRDLDHAVELCRDALAATKCDTELFHISETYDAHDVLRDWVSLLAPAP